MSRAGDSCDWLFAKNPQASDTPTSKIFLTLLCRRTVTPSDSASSIVWLTCYAQNNLYMSLWFEQKALQLASTEEVGMLKITPEEITLWSTFVR